MEKEEAKKMALLRNFIGRGEGSSGGGEGSSGGIGNTTRRKKSGYRITLELSDIFFFFLLKH